MYRMEHPKPQFERATWKNLNGEWQFEIDHGNSGEDRGLYKEDTILNQKINVPFCPESKLSGVGYTEFMTSVWYKREIELTATELKKRVVLHFGAVDYKAIVYVNGQQCGEHKGGYVSFSFDITSYVKEGKNVITVHVEDDTRSGDIPSGKQSYRYHSFGCFYTRTTGIWQTVWLEFTPKAYVKSAKYYPDPENGAITIVAKTVGKGMLKAEVKYEGVSMGDVEVKSFGGVVTCTIPLKETHLWEIGKGRLYDLYFTYGEDEVKSYFGLRSVRLEGYKFLINEKSVFQRLVLDQGFYPDGIYTAPSDQELQADIDRSLAMGFNGARLHEKIFEERFLYYCDKKGYIVWGEYPNWGFDVSKPDAIYNVLPEWIESVERDFNHPALIGWCPFNELSYRGGAENYDIMKGWKLVFKLVYDQTKLIDPTRPVLDCSGGLHYITDIDDVHDYCQDPLAFRENFGKLATEGKCWDAYGGKEYVWSGRPFFVSEYGGTAWAAEKSAWGYGNAPQNEQEFLDRIKGLTDVLMDNELMFGFCYTQLTDVEQEQNGLYAYDRKPKFSTEKIYPIFARKAAIEE